MAFLKFVERNSYKIETTVYMSLALQHLFSTIATMSNDFQEEFADQTDDELVATAQAKAGQDDRTFRVLMERHQNTVWRVCYNFLHNAEDAEDLTQEVFLKAYRNLVKFEGRSSFRTWVYRIAINTSQNELRRRSRRPQVSSTPLDIATEFMPSSEDVEKSTQIRAEHQMLLDAFKLLRPVESQILIMKDLEGRPYADIAKELKISLSAAKMRVQRARDALSNTYHRLANIERVKLNDLP